MLLLAFVLFGGYDELVTFAVNVDDLDVGLWPQQLAQLSDIHVHAAGVEVGVLFPDLLQGMVPL
jgi:hypothetical protein